MNNVTLFLIPYEYGNYVRTHGQSIIAVQAKVGRKHMTVIDAYKGALIDRIKFDLKKKEQVRLVPALLP